MEANAAARTKKPKASLRKRLGRLFRKKKRAPVEGKDGARAEEEEKADTGSRQVEREPTTAVPFVSVAADVSASAPPVEVVAPAARADFAADGAGKGPKTVESSAPAPPPPEAEEAASPRQRFAEHAADVAEHVAEHAAMGSHGGSLVALALERSGHVGSELAAEHVCAVEGLAHAWLLPRLPAGVEAHAHEAVALARTAVPVVGTCLVVHLLHHDWHRAKGEWRQRHAGASRLAALLFGLAALADLADAAVHAVVIAAHVAPARVDHGLLHAAEHLGLVVAVAAILALLAGEALSARAHGNFSSCSTTTTTSHPPPAKEQATRGRASRPKDPPPHAAGYPSDLKVKAD